MKSFWVAVVVGLGLAANAGASRYEIPLPELERVYSTGDIAPDRTYGVHFSFPYAFERIDVVYLSITGNIAPALHRNEFSGEEWEVYPKLTFVIPTPLPPPNPPVFIDGQGVVVTLSENGPFHTEHAFAGASDKVPDWSFLLGGEGWMDLGFPSLGPRPLMPEEYPSGDRQVIPAIAGITDARLIVEGVAVPEPAALCSVLLTAPLLLARWRRLA